MKMTMTTMMLPRKTITITPNPNSELKKQHKFQFVAPTQEMDFSPHWKSKERLPLTQEARCLLSLIHMDVSENSGFSTFSIIFTIHFGVSLFLETPIL